MTPVTTCDVTGHFFLYGPLPSGVVASIHAKWGGCSCFNQYRGGCASIHCKAFVLIKRVGPRFDLKAGAHLCKSRESWSVEIRKISVTSAILISTDQLCPTFSAAVYTILTYYKQQKAWAWPGNETILCIYNSRVASFPGSPEREMYTRGEPGIFST